MKPVERLLTANGLLWRDVHRRKTLTLICSSIVKCRRVWHHYAIVGPKREHSCPRVILSATKWTWVVIIDSPCSTLRHNMIHFVLFRVVFERYELFPLVYPENTRRAFLSPFQVLQEIKLICFDKNYICIAVINWVNIVLYSLFIITLERFFFDPLEWKRGIDAFTFFIRYDFTRLT